MAKEVPGGYNGKLLRASLTEKRIITEDLDPLFCRRYFGGLGFIVYYLWKELKPGIDALSPDNKLIFANGPASGMQLPGTARHCIGAKSPLTGGLAKAESGGFWAAEFKRAGFDVIIVEGRSETPVYLWIQDGEASIRDASHLWGMETKETEAAIRAELGDDRVQLAMIGPGGENLVRYACIMHGLFDAAGRGGVGAVMGSKNLKAIAVRGHKLPKIADREKMKEIRQKVMAGTALHPSLSVYGTGGPEMYKEESLGNLPVRNFRDGLFPEVKQINGMVIKDTMRIGMRGCYACQIRCKKIVQFEEPYHADGAYGGPEYETIAALGSDCCVSNLKSIVKGNERCNAYSLDTISTGSTIAFAMECFEKGLLTTEDTGGIDLRFGNDGAMLECIELIAKRQGLGDLLAEGTLRLARRIGNGAEEFAMHVKGLEPGMHDPRVKYGMGLGYMVTPAGADHCCNMHDTFFTSDPMIEEYHPFGIHLPLAADDIGPHKVELFRIFHFKRTILDSLLICTFTPYPYPLLVDLVSTVTGWDTGIAELLRVAERILTLARLFNLREGLSASDDVLPNRFFQPKTNGVLSDLHIDRAEFEKAKKYYYALLGWDNEGVPLPERVEGLYIE